MHLSKMLRWGFWTLLVCLSGCSSMHVDVAPAVDWSNVSHIVLSAPAQDPWLLAPAIRKELQGMGMTVLAEGEGDPDLAIRFFAKEGPDLDANGNMLTRLQSLHVQFVDPATATVVAVADYFYSEGSSGPDKGVAAVFAKLREELNAGAASPLTTVTAPVTDPVPRQSVSQSVLESQSPPLEPARSPAPVGSLEVESVSQTQALEPPVKTIAPVTDKAKARKIETKTESPWTPKFKSWGFENWGKQNSGGD